MANGAPEPTGIKITSYQVGFGDCYLLSLDYAGGPRHVLIDFGTKLRSKVKLKVDMVAIAKKIAADCGDKLTMVVATHRHYDHISGFDRGGQGDGPGAVIRALKPELVLQPWTEDPKLAPDATAPVSDAASNERLHVRSLDSMHRLAAVAHENVARLVGGGTPALAAAAAELEYLGGDNITNRDAVENLMTMGKRPAQYLQLGSELDLGDLLPGVTVHVLGPPTLSQNPKLGHYASSSEQYWKLQALAAEVPAATPAADNGLAGGTSDLPVAARWFARRMQSMRADSALSILRSLDGVMNNTSLILLFEIGARRLLFPGDAQLENWSVALADENIRRLLADVDVYKVGHHGSRNANPIDLWNGFTRKSKPGFNTLLSTHADEYDGVPRASLHKALEEQSKLLSTENFEASELSETITLSV